MGKTIDKKVAASFTLSDEDVTRLKAEALQHGKRKRLAVPNPHNKGFYYYFIETLKALGANRAHPAAVVTAKFRELTNLASSKDGDGQTFWKRWTKAVGDVGPWKDRFEQNAEVLQRIPRTNVPNSSPYGLRLLQVGTKVLGTRGIVIDILRDRDGLRKYRLNTDSNSPINQFRQRREDSRRAKRDRFASAARVEQRGRCSICLRDNRKLCLDHCHVGGYLRGLICGKCNSGIGFFDDSIPSILRAALYLEAARGRASTTSKRKHGGQDE